MKKVFLLLMMLATTIISQAQISKFQKGLNASAKTGDTIEVRGDYYDGPFYEKDWDWYGTIHAENGDTYTFDILCDKDRRFPTPGKQYTYDDMIGYYTFRNPFGVMVTEYSTDATFLYWIDEDNMEYIDATMTTTKNKTYHITYRTHTRPEVFTNVYDTLPVVKMYYDTIEEGKIFQVAGTNDSVKAVFTLLSDHVTGHFTTNDIYGELDAYTFVEVNTNIRFLCDFEVDIAEGKGEGNYKIDAKFYAYNGKCYNFSMDYVVPEAKDTMNVACDNMKVETLTFYDYFVIGYEMTASNDKYIVSATLDNPTGMTEAITLLNKDSTTIYLYAGEITVDNFTNAHGWALGYDSIYYRFDMTGVAPQPTRKQSFTIPYAVYSTNNPEAPGVIQYLGYSADSTEVVSFAIYTDKVAGTFTEKDAYADYTYVGDWVIDHEFGGGYLSNLYNLYTINFDVTDLGNGLYRGVATYMGRSLIDPTDSPEFNITFEKISDINDPSSLHGIKIEKENNVKKFIRDGQLVILRDGKEFNVAGQIINHK